MQKYVYYLALFLGVFNLNIGCTNTTNAHEEPWDSQATCQDSYAPCNQNIECRESEVCVEHECRCAYNREYEFTVLFTGTYERTDDGSCWDPGTFNETEMVWECDDPPDPYYVLTLGDNVFVSTSQENVSAAAWEGVSHVAMITPMTTYGFALFDQDETQDDNSERQHERLDVDIETDGPLDDLILYNQPEWTFSIENLRKGKIGISTQHPNKTPKHQAFFKVRPLP